MNPEEYETMAQMESQHWWHKGREAILSAMINKHITPPPNTTILNVGCGTGGTIPMLNRFGMVHNLETYEPCVEFCKQKGYENVQLYDGNRLPFDDAFFDMVAGLDVLEHIEGHYEAAEDWIRVLKPGGHLVLTVPAFQWMWSGHDVVLHHFRRYTKKTLWSVFKELKITPLKFSYAIAPTFIPAALFRLVTKKNKTTSSHTYIPIPNWINQTLYQTLKMEAVLHRYTNMPFGTSVMLIAQKHL